MLNKLFFVFLFCFSFSQNIIHDFGDEKILFSDFYFENQKNSWEDLSNESKIKTFNGFIKKELVLYDAESLGLDLKPSLFVKLKEREKQLAVNLYYELFVAGSKVSQNYLSLIKKNIKRELSVYHILLGYEGCALPSSFSKTKEDVFLEASSLSEKIQKNLFSKNVKEKVSVFKEHALSFSEDPNIKQNEGFLGWVSWGRSVDDFQVPLFSLNKGVVSDPILTPYGYHLVFVDKERPSNYSYYDPFVLDDQLVRFGLQSVSVDTLRQTSSYHDSSLLSDGGFVLNSLFVESFLLLFDDFLSSKNLRFSKKVVLDFFNQLENKNVLFVFKGKGFGLGWFVDKIKKTPSTRISPFSSSEDFENLLVKFVLQEEVFQLAKSKNIFSSFYFKKEFRKHKKNLIYNEYIKNKNSLIKKVDSSLVSLRYKEGLKDSVFYFPKKAQIKEIKSSSEAFIDSALSYFSETNDFDLVFSRFGKKEDINVLKSVSFGSKGVLGDVIFSLSEGGVSEKISNTDKTFSFIKLVSFVPKKPKPFSLVFSQIEKQIIKEREDSIKFNLLENLKKSFNFSFNYEEL